MFNRANTKDSLTVKNHDAALSVKSKTSKRRVTFDISAYTEARKKELEYETPTSKVSNTLEHLKTRLKDKLMKKVHSTEAFKQIPLRPNSELVTALLQVKFFTKNFKGENEEQKKQLDSKIEHLRYKKVLQNAIKNHRRSIQEEAQIKNQTAMEAMS